MRGIQKSNTHEKKVKSVTGSFNDQTFTPPVLKKNNLKKLLQINGSSMH